MIGGKQYFRMNLHLNLIQKKESNGTLNISKFKHPLKKHVSGCICINYWLSMEHLQEI